MNRIALTMLRELLREYHRSGRMLAIKSSPLGGWYIRRPA